MVFYLLRHTANLFAGIIVKKDTNRKEMEDLEVKLVQERTSLKLLLILETDHDFHVSSCVSSNGPSFQNVSHKRCNRVVELLYGSSCVLLILRFW